MKKRRKFLELVQAFSHLSLNKRRILHTDGQPYQSVTDALSLLLGGTDVAMRGRRRMTACRGGVAERGTEGNAGRLAHEAIDGVAAAGEIETEHVAETTVQQTAGQFTIGMIGASGVEDARDAGLLG